MKIEKVTIADAKELLGIYGYYVVNTAISLEHTVPTLAEFEQRITEISKKYPFLKATENGEIIGYCYAGTFKPRKSYERSVETTVYVRKDRRGAGVGRALYTALEKALKSMGILNMNACIVLPRGKSEYVTEASRLFHEKMGFSLAGKFDLVAYKFDSWFDVLWMQKHIGTHPHDPPDVKFGEYEI